jgi:hypothetical protein
MGIISLFFSPRNALRNFAIFDPLYSYRCFQDCISPPVFIQGSLYLIGSKASGEKDRPVLKQIFESQPCAITRLMIALLFRGGI